MLAVVQTNVKRMLAYSSISHAGFILVGIEAAGHTAGDPDGGFGVPSSLLYLLLYSVLVVGTFAVVTAVGRTGDDATDLAGFRGLGESHPALALGMTVLLLAQAGVPLTSGFIAKFGVIQAAVEEQQLRDRDHRHGLRGDRRVPLPADHGRDVDHRAGGGRRRARAGARPARQRPRGAARGRRSRCSSGSSPAG